VPLGKSTMFLAAPSARKSGLPRVRRFTTRQRTSQVCPFEGLARHRLAKHGKKESYYLVKMVLVNQRTILRIRAVAWSCSQVSGPTVSVVHSATPHADGRWSTGT